MLMSETPVQNVGEDAFSGFGEPMPGDMPVLPDLPEATPYEGDE
jgi:hypothetical protein